MSEQRADLALVFHRISAHEVTQVGRVSPPYFVTAAETLNTCSHL